VIRATFLKKKFGVFEPINKFNVNFALVLFAESGFQLGLQV